MEYIYVDTWDLERKRIKNNHGKMRESRALGLDLKRVYAVVHVI